MVVSRVYMDWNATAPLGEPARLAMIDALTVPGNASSVHAEGRAARAGIDKARRQVAALVAAEPANVIFTSGATEAANHVLTPDFRMGRSPLLVSHLYVSAIEHPAVREGGRFTPEQVSELAVTRQGILDLQVLEAALAAHDRAEGLPLVALMLVNNETGIVQPVAEAARLVHRYGGLMIVDVVQAVGRIPVDIAELDADFMMVSSHKIGGPKGVGADLARRGLDARCPDPRRRTGKGSSVGNRKFPWHHRLRSRC